MSGINKDELAQQAKEKAEEAKKAAMDTAEKVKNMSANEAKELAKEKLESMKSLDKSSKMKYGGIALVVLIALYFIIGGGSMSKEEYKQQKVLITSKYDNMIRRNKEQCKKGLNKIEQEQKQDIGNLETNYSIDYTSITGKSRYEREEKASKLQNAKNDKQREIYDSYGKKSVELKRKCESETEKMYDEKSSKLDELHKEYKS